MTTLSYPSPTLNERARGLLLGLAAGDALGTTVEFSPRGTFTPLTTIVGGGPFALKPGQWTDDTSMALCLGESLRACQGFDAADQMRRYVNWSHHGYMSSTGRCFDIGTTVSAALQRFLESDDPYSGSTHPRSAGNGCLMRLGPIPLFAFAHDRAQRLDWAARSSRTTHGAEECVHATQAFGEALHRALKGESKEAIVRFEAHDIEGIPSARLAAVLEGGWQHKRRDQLRGSGYVVEALEAALWCFATTESFEQAVLMAANLGDDADTTAAICGQLAGAHYGIRAIPQAWREITHEHEFIEKMATDLLTRDASRDHAEAW